MPFRRRRASVSKRAQSENLGHRICTLVNLVFFVCLYHRAHLFSISVCTLRARLPGQTASRRTNCPITNRRSVRTTNFAVCVCAGISGRTIYSERITQPVPRPAVCASLQTNFSQSSWIPRVLRTCDCCSRFGAITAFAF